MKYMKGKTFKVVKKSEPTGSLVSALSAQSGSTQVGGKRL